MSPPSLSPETGQVVNRSGLTELTAFVPSARLAGAKATNAAVKIIPAISVEFFIRWLITLKSSRRQMRSFRLQWWKEERQGAPDTQPPVKFIMLARLCLSPLVAAQASLCELRGRQWFGVHKQLKVFVRPADALEFGGDLFGQRATIVFANGVHHSGIEI